VDYGEKGREKMSSTTPRRYYIDHNDAREEAIVRRVLVSPTRPVSPAARPAPARRNAAQLLGVGRLVRGRLIRRVQ
jgi:hypothetical protein